MARLLTLDPRIRLVLTLYPEEAEIAINVAGVHAWNGEVGNLRVATFDENNATDALWRQGLLTTFTRTHTRSQAYGLVPGLVLAAPAYLEGNPSLPTADSSTTLVGDTLVRPVQSIPQYLVTETFVFTDSMGADLLAHVLRVYDPTQPPANLNPTNVSVSFNVQLVALNMRNSEFELKAEMFSSWHDPRLMWDERWGLSSISPQLEDIWMPILWPVRTKTRYAVEDSRLVVNNTGWVHKIELFKVTVGCEYTYISYPGDRQQCTFNVTTATPLVALLPGAVQTARGFHTPPEFKWLQWGIGSLPPAGTDDGSGNAMSPDNTEQVG